MRLRYYLFLILTLLLFSWSTVYGEGSADGLFPFGIADEDQDLVTTSRSPRPISKIAENVTVITAEEIARLNAHSLSEVLQTVPGIFVDKTQSPGGFAFLSVQGQTDGYSTILLFIDGIRQGNLFQGTIDPGMLPVQNIERIEIIKGAASTAWGPALGGVINVVTKTPETNRPFSGTVSASYGEKKTSGLGTELTGTSNGIGYYLSGDSLHSAGLLPNTGVNRNAIYGKLTYDLPSQAKLTFGISDIEAHRGLVEVYVFDATDGNGNPAPYTEHDNSITRRYHSFLTFTAPLQPDLSLELTLHDSTINDKAFFGSINAGNTVDLTNIPALDERNSGGKAKLTWGDNNRNLAIGLEYLHSSIKNRDLLHPEWGFFPDRRRDSLSVYANGAYTLGNLTILPGIRYDKTGLDEDTTNYTIGATYRLAYSTLLRSYWATGYGMPNALLKSVPARVNTLQAGIESEAVPYLWLKGTYFYNHIWQIQDYWNQSALFSTNNLQGFEIEAKTVPVAGFSLSGGYTFTDARDGNTNQRIKGVPINLAKLALSYANAGQGTNLLLSGNYSWQNMDWVPHYAHYTPIIWNLHFTQKLIPANDLSPELFLNVNNIFNGSQYWDYWYKNNARWLEGGVRFRF